LSETQELPLAELDIPAAALVCTPKSYRMSTFDTELRDTQELPIILDNPGTA
jgi:hypothetical protein